MNHSGRGNEYGRERDVNHVATGYTNRVLQYHNVKTKPILEGL
jgi:hypothetical protein